MALLKVSGASSLDAPTPGGGFSDHEADSGIGTLPAIHLSGLRSGQDMSPPRNPVPSNCYRFQMSCKKVLSPQQQAILEEIRLQVEERCRSDPVWESERTWLLGAPSAPNSHGCLHALVCRGRKNIFQHLEKGVYRRRRAATERGEPYPRALGGVPEDAPLSQSAFAAADAGQLSKGDAMQRTPDGHGICSPRTLPDGSAGNRPRHQSPPTPPALGATLGGEQLAASGHLRGTCEASQSVREENRPCASVPPEVPKTPASPDRSDLLADLRINGNFLIWTAKPGSSSARRPVSLADILVMPPIITQCLATRFLHYQTHLNLIKLYQGSRRPIPENLAQRCDALRRDIEGPWEQCKDVFAEARAQFTNAKASVGCPPASLRVFVLPFLHFDEIKKRLAELNEAAMSKATQLFRPSPLASGFPSGKPPVPSTSRSSAVEPLALCSGQSVDVAPSSTAELPTVKISSSTMPSERASEGSGSPSSRLPLANSLSSCVIPPTTIKTEVLARDPSGLSPSSTQAALPEELFPCPSPPAFPPKSPFQAVPDRPLTQLPPSGNASSRRAALTPPTASAPPSSRLALLQSADLRAASESDQPTQPKQALTSPPGSHSEQHILPAREPTSPTHINPSSSSHEQACKLVLFQSPDLVSTLYHLEPTNAFSPPMQQLRPQLGISTLHQQQVHAIDPDQAMSVSQFTDLRAPGVPRNQALAEKRLLETHRTQKLELECRYHYQRRSVQSQYTQILFNDPSPELAQAADQSKSHALSKLARDYQLGLERLESEHRREHQKFLQSATMKRPVQPPGSPASTQNYNSQPMGLSSAPRTVPPAQRAQNTVPSLPGASTTSENTFSSSANSSPQLSIYSNDVSGHRSSALLCVSKGGSSYCGESQESHGENHNTSIHSDASVPGSHSSSNVGLSDASYQLNLPHSETKRSSAKLSKLLQVGKSRHIDWGCGPNKPRKSSIVAATGHCEAQLTSASNNTASSSTCGLDSSAGRLLGEACQPKGVSTAPNCLEPDHLSSANPHVSALPWMCVEQDQPRFEAPHCAAEGSHFQKDVVRNTGVTPTVPKSLQISDGKEHAAPCVAAGTGRSLSLHRLSSMSSAVEELDIKVNKRSIQVATDTLNAGATAFDSPKRRDYHRPLSAIHGALEHPESSNSTAAEDSPEKLRPLTAVEKSVECIQSSNSRTTDDSPKQFLEALRAFARHSGDVLKVLQENPLC